MSVLVLDANANSAIAIIRSLGRRGIDIIAADPSPRAIGLKSRYIKQAFCYPDSLHSEKNFINFIKNKLVNSDVELIIPPTDKTMIPLIRNRDIIPDSIILAAPDKFACDIVQDKIRTCELAYDCGVPIPKIYFSGRNSKDVNLNGIMFPVIVKPAKSKSWINDKGYSLSVSYAATHIRLTSLIDKYASFGNVIIQEYVKGNGCGIEMLVDNGEVLVAFQHNRIREVPVTGGASSMRESVALNPKLFGYAKRIVSRLKWTGVIMAEFKHNPELDESYLIELNGRFWGSLNLAIASGVDFPYYLYQLLVRKENKRHLDYKIGIKSKSVAKDIEWIEDVFRNKSRCFMMSYPPRVRAFITMLSLFEPGVHYDVQAWDDPWPGIHELFNIANSYISRASKLFHKQ